MSHLDEEQLVLHYYGEDGLDPETERHLDECGECRALYGSLQRALNAVDSMAAPERGAQYGGEVWRRIEHGLPAPGWFTAWPSLRLVLAGAAMAALLTVAFLAGRVSMHPGSGAPRIAADGQSRERVLMVAVGDYLDRSQMMLVELANANTDGPLDISSEQARAQDLINETRLYRQTAVETGDASVAGILDELERVLLDIAHAPSRLSPVELEKLRGRLKTEGILFKIRVVNSNVQNQEG